VGLLRDVEPRGDGQACWTSTPTSRRPNTGQAIVAIDVAAFGDVGEFRRRVDKVVGDMRNSERMPGVDRIWVPGEQSNAKRVAKSARPLAPQSSTAGPGGSELGIAPLAR
jgi:LDH2 family malate/lactate/ureidoglycolate dehydrogenase